MADLSPNMKHRNLLIALSVTAAFAGSACSDSDSDPTDAGGQDAAHGGTGGMGGSDAGGMQDAALEGTRCDNGIGAGGDGCAENFGSSSIGFSVRPEHLTTGVAQDGEVAVHVASLYTIPDEVIDELENNTTLLRADSDEPVDVELEVTDSLVWAGHDVDVKLTPSSELSDGWYVLRVEGALDTGNNTPIHFPMTAPDVHEAFFRVGSAPFVSLVTNCVASLVIELSEPVEVPATLPLSFEVDGAALTCTRELEDGVAPSPATTLTLSCAELDSWRNLEISFAEGFVSADDTPLRNAAGDTSFTIAMPAEGTGGDCRSTPAVTEPPAF